MKNRFREFLDLLRPGTSTNGNGNGTAPEGDGKRLVRLRHALLQVLQGDPGESVAAYRHLTFQLHHGLPRGEAKRSLLVATPADPDVAASGSMALAWSLAEELRRPVLLVEASDGMELGRTLGAPSSRGLTDLMAEPGLRLQDLVLPTSHEQVSFLPRGTLHHGLGMASPLVEKVLDRLREPFDFVVISGGAVLADGLALELARHVGQVLLLVAEGRTPIGDIDSAQDTLRLCKAERVAVVLTERLGVTL